MRRSVSHVFQTSAIAALAGGLIALAPASDAVAAKFKVLHSFCGPMDGCDPKGGLVMDQAGNFFGTASEGGKHEAGEGTVYELLRTDTGRLKYKRGFSFCNRFECDPPIANPIGNLIVDTQGNLYGLGGGWGTVFELSPPTGGSGKWTDKLLYQFCSQQNCADGSGPVGGLVYAGQSSGALYDGTSPLYGATAGGGNNTASGVVFELTNSGGQWAESVLYDFCSQGGDKCKDGKLPQGSMTIDEAGNLYGTTLSGGAGDVEGGGGVAFELAPDEGGSWTYALLYTFCSLKNCEDGYGPGGDLIWDSAGNLLGDTAAGGEPCSRRNYGCGTIFRLAPNGGMSQLTVLYSFCRRHDCKDGDEPQAGVVLDNSGNIFGVTYEGGGNDIDYYGFGGGTAYELVGSTLKTLHSFCSQANCADGENPEAPLIMDQAGRLLGTTSLGGAFGTHYGGGGAVFGVTP
jgi:hypothetical protein